MPNKFNQQPQTGKPPKTQRGSTHTTVNEKTASWAGLPGKSGPNRAQGVEKLRTHPKTEGL